jgi:hypothetical protein
MLRFTPSRLFRFCGGFVLPLLFIAVAGGCGGGKGNVSGTVTVDGKPLPMGTIVFTSESGPAVAAEILDGKYAAVGVPTGDVKVSLDLSALKSLAGEGGARGRTASEKMAEKFGKGAGADTAGKYKDSFDPTKNPNLPAEAKEQAAQQHKALEDAQRRKTEVIPLLHAIPDKYTDPKTSGWTLRVSLGDNTFDAKVTK